MQLQKQIRIAFHELTIRAFFQIKVIPALLMRSNNGNSGEILQKFKELVGIDSFHTL